MSVSKSTEQDYFVAESTSAVPHEPKFTPPTPPSDVTTHELSFKADAFLQKESGAFEARVLATHTPAPKSDSPESIFNSCKKG